MRKEVRNAQRKIKLPICGPEELCAVDRRGGRQTSTKVDGSLAAVGMHERLLSHPGNSLDHTRRKEKLSWIGNGFAQVARVLGSSWPSRLCKNGFWQHPRRTRGVGE